MLVSQQQLHPGDLKNCITNYLNRLLEPIRKKFNDPELKKLTDSAYPKPSKSELMWINSLQRLSPPPFLSERQPSTSQQEANISPAVLDIRVGKIVEIQKVCIRF